MKMQASKTEFGGDAGTAVNLTADDEFTDMAALFVAACRQYASRQAYRADGEWITYGECLARVSAVSSALEDVLSEHRSRARTQPVIAVLLSNGHFYLECFFTAALTHSIILPINNRLIAPEVTGALVTSGAVVLVTCNVFAKLLAEIDWKSTSISTVIWTSDAGDLPIKDQRSWNSLASPRVPFTFHRSTAVAAYLQGFCTSGTTGQPKTVLHTHRSVRLHSLASIEALGLSADDEHCWAHVGPMFHVGDAVFVWIGLLLGSRHVFHEKPFQVGEVAELLAMERVSIVKLVPSMLRLMCESKSMPDLDFSSLRWILTGGASPDAGLVRKTAKRFGCDFIQGYGMTEATCHIAFKVETRAPATEGLSVLPCLQIRILNSCNEALEPGMTGEIAIKGDTLFGGYLSAGAFEATNSRTFTSDNYFLTGDLGYLDTHDKLHVVGRSKDMINVGGENVFAWEVEDSVRLLADVVDCAAFPMPHQMLGEVVTVAVVGGGALTEEQVKKHCRRLLASFKVPQRVYFLDEIPRTPTGKAQKHLIANRIASTSIEQAGNLGIPAHGSPSTAEMVTHVLADFMKTISSEPIKADQSLFDAGLDSLGAAELIELLERRFRIGVSPTLLYDYPTPAALGRYFETIVASVPENLPDQTSAADDNPVRSTSARGQRAPLTLVTWGLQALGPFIRPAFLVFSFLPIMVFLSLFSLWASPYVLLLTGPLWLFLSLLNAMAVALVIKTAFGRLKFSSCELWSIEYFRWLLVHNLFRSLEVPLGVLRGTAILTTFYRLCGAKIGRGTRIYSVTLQDLELITIGENAVLGRDVNIQPNHISERRLVRQPIHIEDHCVIGENASILGGAHLRSGAKIPPLAVVRASHPTAFRGDNCVVAPRQPETRLAAIQWLAVYLVVAYLSSAAIACGLLFVHVFVETFGEAFPSIYAVALGTLPEAHLSVAFFAAAALALYVVIPVCYFLLVAASKRLVLAKLTPHLSPKGWALWSHLLYRTLIDVPFFRSYLRLTVGSHLTKWNFQLLGANVRARPFLAAPYTAEPELLNMADDAMLAGNVSLYALNEDNKAEPIQLGRSAIVANSCILHGGAILSDAALLGDLSTAVCGTTLPPNSIAAGVPPRIIGRTNFRPDRLSNWQYLWNQTGLIFLQTLTLAAINVAGFVAMGALVIGFLLPMPSLVRWLAAPAVLLVPRFFKLVSIPVFKWVILGRVQAAEHPSHGWYYARWQLIETLLWDAEDAILSQLHGMPLLNLLWRTLGAKIGSNCCIFSSSLACEYDLKQIGNGVVLHHNSLVFCHSIERHSWLFRPTVIQNNVEIGSFAIVEAGGFVMSDCVIAPHTAIHAHNTRRPRDPVADATRSACCAPPSTSNRIPLQPSTVPPKAAVLSPAPIGELDLKTRFQALQEFVQAAYEKLDGSAWDYLVGGSDTETTCARNRMALDCLGLRPRVLRDISKIDCSTVLFGKRLRIPVLCAPVGALEIFDPAGAAGVAEAAAHFGNGLLVSSVSQPGLERTAAAAGQALKIFQLYVRGDQAWVARQIHRAEASNYDAFCLTVDTDLYSRRERDIIARHQRQRVRTNEEIYQARFNWQDVVRIRKISKLPLVLKGVATAEDASLAVDHGVDAIYVSNHGGRQLDHGLGAIAVLPEIVDAVAGRAKILLDGAITRGTDVVKAMALGADAVAVGRLYVYGLAAAGPPGVARLLEILEDEIRICLGLLGVTNFADLSTSSVREAPPVVKAHLHSAFRHLFLGN